MNVFAGTIGLGLLTFAAAVSTAFAAPPNVAQSMAWTQAVIPVAGMKRVDVPSIPFLLNGEPAFKFSDLHATLEPHAQGVMVKLRFANMPSYRKATTGSTTPMRLSLKDGDKVLFTLDGIQWDVQCFHGSNFGARILVPESIYERIDAIEVAPMTAVVRECTSSSSRRG